MRTLPIIALLTLAVPDAHAHEYARAQDPWYVQFGLGTVSASDTDYPLPGGGSGSVGFDLGYNVSLALGYDIGGWGDLGLAAEAEGLYSYFKLDENDLPKFTTSSQGSKASAVLLNLVADYHLNRKTALYLGGGFGWANNIEYETLDTGSLRMIDKDGLAGQAKLGVRYHLGNLKDVSIGYRYFATEDVRIAQGTALTKSSFENHILEVLLRWGL